MVDVWWGGVGTAVARMQGVGEEVEWGTIKLIKQSLPSCENFA